MDSGSIRVLHVDDEPDFADLAAIFLEREDDRLTVETVTSAEEGIGRLADGDVDCVVSDYDMPRTNGIEFLEQVREAYPELPFILFTGKGSEEVASEAIGAGVTDYLQKQGETSQYELLANRITNAVGQARAERQVQLQQRQYRDLFENAPIMYVLTRDEDGQPVIEDCNDRFAEKLGYDREDLLGRSMLDHYTDDSIERMRASGDHQRARGDGIANRERSLVTEDGDTIETLLCASPRLDEHGDAIGGQALYLDITERKEREAELREERNRLAALFEHAPQPIIEGTIEADDHYPIVEMNDAFTDVFGYDATEIVGYDAADVLVPDEERVEAERLRERIAAGESFSTEVERTTADGKRTFLLDVVAYGTDSTPADGWFATYTDITDRKERERELELYETIVETVPDGVYAMDENFHYIAMNQARADLAGYSKEELIGSHMSRINTEEAVEMAKQDRDRILDGGIDGEVMVTEHTFVTPDGEEVPCEVRFRALPPAEDGSFRGTAGTVRDISDWKEYQRDLELYETMLETVPDGVYVLDEDLHYRVVNQGMADLTGYPKEELIGSHMSLINTEAAVESAKRNRDQLLGENGGVDDEIRVVEHSHVTADDEEIPTEVRFRALPPAEDGSFRGTAGVVRDITDRRERQAELERQNERLKEFTSVISHDLQNPLRVADGKIELAREACDSEHLSDAAGALDRMDQLIENLLTLAREGRTIEETDAVDLAPVVEACWETVETADATLAVDAGVTIHADRSRLRQLLENLVRNAVEHDGRDVTVTVGDLDDGRGIYVADDGDGIPEDEREQVFERGYSTSAEGMGFGLAIVEKIAEAHGWEIRLTESESGGARFEITGVEPVA